MKLSWAQVFFYYVFDLLLLLLFLFGESFLGVYVVGLTSLFFLTYSQHLDFGKISQYKTELLLWFIFLFGLMISSFNTHSLPLTINSLIFYGFAFGAFVFFLLLKKSLFHHDFVLWNLVIVVLGLGGIGLGFNFFPDLAAQLPGMNLIYATYGHNHFGALAILFIPITWYLMIRYRSEKGKLIFFLVAWLFLVANLIFSFGRTVLLLGLAELAILFFLSANVLGKIAWWIKLIFIVALALLAGAFFFKNSYSLASYWQKSVTCPLPQYQDRICKKVSADLRGAYWLTALKGFADWPWFGYGPGTYKLIAERYKVRPDAGTSYAHNTFFQLLAEGGLILTIPFALLIGLFFVRSFRSVDLSSANSSGIRDDWQAMVLLGLAAIAIDGLVDFDWNFLGVFVVCLILFGLLIRQNHEAKSLPKIKARVAKVFYFVVFGGLLLLMVVNLIVETLLWRGNVNGAVVFFPYFQSHMQLYFDSAQLTSQNQKVIEKIYRHTPYYYLKNNVATAEKQKTLDLIAPWHYYESSLNQLPNKTDYQEVRPQLERTLTLYQKAKKFGFGGQVLADHNLALQAVETADSYLNLADYKTAATLYQVALEFDDWIYNDTYPKFLYGLETSEQKKEFWQLMRNFPGQSFGKHIGVVSGIHLSLLRTAIDQRDWEMIEVWFDRFLEISPWSTGELATKVSPSLQILADEAVRRNNFEVALKMTGLLSRTNTYYAKLQPGNLLLLMGEASRAKEAFADCNQWWQENLGVTHDNCQRMINIPDDRVDALPYWLTSKALLEQ